MPTSLLLDFGATRIKAALCDTNNGNLFEIKAGYPHRQCKKVLYLKSHSRHC